MAEQKRDVASIAGHKAKIVCFFAHKGGVSKTTNVYHIGWMLASQLDMRVLLIDADPQCNLTHTLFPISRRDTSWREGVERGDIFTAIKPIHYGMRPEDDLLHAECIPVKNATSDPNCGGELWLMPGNLMLSTVEPQLSLAHNINMNTSESFPIFYNMAGGFRELFVATGAHLDVDLILVDMGPSIGELNKNLFISSDCFVIPCAPDSYSKSTLSTMARILPKWGVAQRELASITASQRFPVKSTPTRFVGYILSLFNVAGRDKKPVRQTQIWMDLIHNQVKLRLLPLLDKLDMCSLLDAQRGVLAEVPHFLSLMPVSQQVGFPVYCMPEEEMMSADEDSFGNPKPMSNSEKRRMTERAKPYHAIYYNCAERLMDACL